MPKKNKQQAELDRELAACAQCLGLRDKEQLATLVLRAFLVLYNEDGWITFPLILSQVPTED